MSETIRAQREAEALVVYVGLDPHQVRSDMLTAHVFRTALSSVLEFGHDTVAPTLTDGEEGASGEALYPTLKPAE